MPINLWSCKAFVKNFILRFSGIQISNTCSFSSVTLFWRLPSSSTIFLLFFFTVWIVLFWMWWHSLLFVSVFQNSVALYLPVFLSILVKMTVLSNSLHLKCLLNVIWKKKLSEDLYQSYCKRNKMNSVWFLFSFPEGRREEWGAWKLPMEHFLGRSLLNLM